ncbi:MULTISPECIES: helix-turn-helix domain-containing protein [unclassified Paenibacillus]|uniref:helix-turn-helix domain-containing protein n=1 Tax=unclassified Paenibacillus TaxID=185978 RepID=UPI0009D2C43B|nr:MULTISPECIES: helix-turn-helix domain-containing protein [unclassified Paenibacillus]SLJ91666.1 Helix-turn-helix domain-containing protein [Paenibacillus sp. RU5A]SOC58770.1 Helix-turn-helix domain-containing protein [Paenibacillus sp. RU26A]SOC67822.1 Helix-turn-helix domain-containing protein [Paenibacillus sp. RU5M]
MDSPALRRTNPIGGHCEGRSVKPLGNMSLFQTNVEDNTRAVCYRLSQPKECGVVATPGTQHTEIAYEVGFNSTSYFINQFRKTMQITPLKFRREVELRIKEGIEH